MNTDYIPLYGLVAQDRRFGKAIKERNLELAYKEHSRLIRCYLSTVIFVVILLVISFFIPEVRV